MTSALLNLLIALRQALLQRAGILLALRYLWLWTAFFDYCGLSSHYGHLHGERVVGSKWNE
jgi:hypothetical protein